MFITMSYSLTTQTHDAHNANWQRSHSKKTLYRHRTSLRSDIATSVTIEIQLDNIGWFSPILQDIPYYRKCLEDLSVKFPMYWSILRTHTIACRIDYDNPSFFSFRVLALFDFKPESWSSMCDHYCKIERIHCYNFPELEPL